MVVTDTFNPIVFDLGSSSARVGWAGSDQPKFVESCFMGCKSSDGTIDPTPLRFSNNGRKYTEPIDPVRCVSYENGRWTVDLEVLAPLTDALCYSQRGLNANAYERPIIMTRPSGADNAYKKIMFKHFMESVEVPAFFLGDTSVLSIYASGRVSGVCADLGASTTCVSVVEKGQVVSSIDYPIGGDYIDQFMLSRLGDAINVPMTDMTEKFVQEMRLVTIREIKHSACKCSHHPIPALQISPAGRSARGQRKSASSASLQSPQSGNTQQQSEVYKLPDGTELDVSSVSDQAAELLFRSQDRDYPGLTECVTEALSQTEDANPFLLLTGGSSHFHGLHTRLVHELENSEKVPLIFPFSQWTHRAYSGFVGASMMASLSTFASLWVTPASYSEHGVDRLINSK